MKAWNQSTKKQLLLFLALLLASMVHAQEVYLSLGTQVPLQHELRVQVHASERVALHAGIGWLTRPYDEAILGIMGKLGTAQVYIDLLENTFQQGWIVQSGIHYQWNNHYVGVFGQSIRLTAEDTPAQLVSTVLGLNSLIYQWLRLPDEQMQLHSQLWQAGLFYGYRWPLPNRRWAIHTEVAFSAHMASKSQLSSPRREVSTLSDWLHNDLQQVYKQYAYLPTLRVAVAYRLNSSKSSSNP